MNRRSALSSIALGALAMTRSNPLSATEPARPLRAGIIGCDTSHATAFTELLNSPDNEGVLATLKVTAAYPGGSKDIPSSIDRVPGYVATLKDKHGVAIVDSIPALLEQVDVVLLESVDGRPHLEQSRPVFEAKKPVFIDKPLAGSLADAIAIYELAKRSGTPVFSSSSLRFSPNFIALKSDPKVGDLVGAITYGPCSLEEHHPDLYWYGIHGVETLYTIMGPGCKTVNRTAAEGTDVATGTWSDGRVGTFRGIRQGKADFGALAFGTQGIAHTTGYGGYKPLVEAIATFFQTGKPPVSPEETLELIAFMSAADESKKRQGAAVSIAELMDQARAEAESKLATRS